MSTITADLAICTFGRGDIALKCLKKSASELSAFKNVIVIDNNPSPLGRDVSDEIAAVGARVIHEPATGLSRARNRALKESTADLVWFIDDDASLEQGFAANVRKHLEVIAAKPPTERPVFGGGLILAAAEDYSLDSVGRFELSLLSCMIPTDAFVQPWGANMFLDRATALKVEGFNPNLGWVKEAGSLLGEEDDLYLRMQKVVEPTRRPVFFAERCAVHHWIPRSRRSLSWLFKRAFKGGRSNYIVYRHAPKSEALSALKQLLKSPSREHALFFAFIIGKWYQRIFKS